MSDPFLDRLRSHTRALQERRERGGEAAGRPATPAPPAATDAPRPTSADPAPAPTAAASPPASAPPSPPAATGVQPGVLAFWQSPVARAHINRRITGDADLVPEAWFAREIAGNRPAAHGVSLRATDASLESRLVDLGAARRVTGVDPSASGVSRARGRVPDRLAGLVDFVEASPLQWRPDEPVDLVIASSVLHRRRDLGALLDRVREWMAPGALLYVDEFVGPDRFQWTDRQIELINRLLARLPAEYRVDLNRDDGSTKDIIGRPDPERFAAEHPDEAVAGSTTVGLLDERFERVAFRPYGGAIFHQLFARIMGNFADRPEIVGLVMELDAILTDTGVVESDYLWAVYRHSPT